MPVNFGLLSAIQAPRVIGALPVRDPNQSMNTLAGGIMSGLQAGQQMQGQALQNEGQATQNAIGKIDLTNKEEALKYSQSKIAAAKQGEDQYIATLRPDDKQTYLTNKAIAAKSIAEAAQGNIEATYMMIDFRAAANSAAAGFQDPKKAEEAYQQVRGTASPDIQKVMDEHYNPVTAPAAITAGAIAHAHYLENKFGTAGAAKDNRTPEIKNAEYVAGVNEKIRNGTATQKDLDSSAGVTRALTKSNATPPSLLLSKSAQDSFTAKSNLDVTVLEGMKTLDLASVEIASMNKAALGPLTGEAAGKFTAQGQALTKSLNQLILQAPAILGLPASALRVASLWDIIKTTKPQTSQYREASQAVIDDLKYTAAVKLQTNWRSEKEAMDALKDKNPAEYNLWMKNHPEPLKTIPKPNLDHLYELFPEAKKLNLEADWTDVEAAAAKAGQPEATAPQAAQPGLQQQVTTPSKTWRINPTTGKLE